MNKIKVFVIDDSALVRQTFIRMFENDNLIKIIDVAPNPIFAEKKMEKNWPDVIILDIEMPLMDGLTFLKQIMQTRPTPTVICSSVVQKNSQSAIEALEIGAVDIITKPQIDIKSFFDESKENIAQIIKSASIARINKINTKITPKESKISNFISNIEDKLTSDVILAKKKTHHHLTDKIIAIGASTGGVVALEVLLKDLPKTTYGTVVVQHMPKGFTNSFAQRLNSVCQMEIREAKNGDKIERGLVLICPGDLHMLVKYKSDGYYVEIKDGPRVSRHKPSVDVLFRSVANEAGSNAIAVILTGMGDDGAKGIKEIKETGGKTIAQDEATCVVFGMPKEAIKLGGIDLILPLEKIFEVF